jgi:hypothetical protein
MSPIFPIKKEGGGPLIPYFLSIARSLFGFNIRASHIFINSLTKPSKAMILTRSNRSSMALALFLYVFVPKVASLLHIAALTFYLFIAENTIYS